MRWRLLVGASSAAAAFFLTRGSTAGDRTAAAAGGASPPPSCSRTFASCAKRSTGGPSPPGSVNCAGCAASSPSPTLNPPLSCRLRLTGMEDAALMRASQASALAVRSATAVSFAWEFARAAAAASARCCRSTTSFSRSRTSASMASCCAVNADRAAATPLCSCPTVPLPTAWLIAASSSWTRPSRSDARRSVSVTCCSAAVICSSRVTSGCGLEKPRGPGGARLCWVGARLCCAGAV